MQRVTYRTLALLLMLLGLIIVQQHTAKAMVVKADAVWLADDPNQPPEHVGIAGSQGWLAADDPNEPGPERSGGMWLVADDPNDPIPPSPERARYVTASLSLDGDPNQPGDPQPERA